MLVSNHFKTFLYFFQCWKWKSKLCNHLIRNKKRFSVNFFANIEYLYFCLKKFSPQYVSILNWYRNTFEYLPVLKEDERHILEFLRAKFPCCFLWIFVYNRIINNGASSGLDYRWTHLRWYFGKYNAIFQCKKLSKIWAPLHTTVSPWMVWKNNQKFFPKSDYTSTK